MSQKTNGLNQGFSSAWVRADSIGITPALNNYTFPQAESGTSIPYEITVESSADGIAYRMTAWAYLRGYGERYHFESAESNPVTPEPSPDVSVDIAECAGVVDIGWVDSNTNPVAVQGFDIQAGIITFGNDRTDRWAALPALMKADEIVETFHRVTGTGDARYRWKRPQNRASRLYPARGVVRSVHRDESRVVIDHEDIPGLMKAMTMGFEVPDRALLEGLGPGQGVEFDVEFAQGRYRIVALRTRTN